MILNPNNINNSEEDYTETSKFILDNIDNELKNLSMSSSEVVGKNYIDSNTSNLEESDNKVCGNTITNSQESFSQEDRKNFSNRLTMPGYSYYANRQGYCDEPC